jgi:hypothetical protein
VAIPRSIFRARPALALITALLLLLDIGAIYKVGTHHKPPHFSAGGAFATNRTGDGSARGQTGIAILGPTTTAPAETTTTSSVPTTTTTTVPGATVPGTTTVPLAPPASVGGGAAPPTTVPSVTSTGLAPAADGLYTYAITGSETSTLGSRSFPATMTIDVHGASGVNPQTSAVFDLDFSPEHTEREIVQWGPSGVAWTFEAGQVTFGLITQTNQGRYSPPMLQIPAQLSAGTVVSGSSNALSGSTLQRVEDWTDTVVGPETLTLAGQSVPTVEVAVHRASRPGASEATIRTTDFWYSPATHMWVKFSEQLQGKQTELGITFTYTESFTATLIGYSPG